MNTINDLLQCFTRNSRTALAAVLVGAFVFALGTSAWLIARGVNAQEARLASCARAGYTDVVLAAGRYYCSRVENESIVLVRVRP